MLYKIAQLNWGSIQIEGIAQKFRDIKIHPQGCIEWDWKETGTSHSAGVQIPDLSFLIQQGVKSIIIGTGFNGRLKVPAKAVDFLELHKIKYFILKSPEAVSKYNQLLEQQCCGALIHSTC